MGSRRKARIVAFQALFGWEFSRCDREDLLSLEWLENPVDDATKTFAQLLISGTLENIEEIDRLIVEQLKNWDFKRLAKVDLALLRMSVYAMRFQTEIPLSVTIDESVDIAKEYGSDESYKFVNGVLDGIKKRLENAS